MLHLWPNWMSVNHCWFINDSSKDDIKKTTSIIKSTMSLTIPIFNSTGDVFWLRLSHSWVVKMSRALDWPVVVLFHNCGQIIKLKNCDMTLNCSLRKEFCPTWVFDFTKQNDLCHRKNEVVIPFWAQTKCIM